MNELCVRSTMKWRPEFAPPTLEELMPVARAFRRAIKDGSTTDGSPMPTTREILRGLRELAVLYLDEPDTDWVEAGCFRVSMTDDCWVFDIIMASEILEARRAV